MSSLAVRTSKKIAEKCSTRKSSTDLRTPLSYKGQYLPQSPLSASKLHDAIHDNTHTKHCLHYQGNQVTFSPCTVRKSLLSLPCSLT